MTVQVAPTKRSLLRSVRAVSSRCSIAAVLLFGCAMLQAAKAAGETRTISFHHTHTKENLTITYKVNGRYDDEALKKINHLMRDWRENEPIKMDPELIDLLWEVHRETGSREPIWVVCGYRSPGTNTMLRNRSRGVAKASQHMLGKAIDFLHSGRLDRRSARGRPARPARRCRLLPGLVVRAHGYRQRAPLAADAGAAARQGPGEGTTGQPQRFRRPFDPARKRGAGERNAERTEFDAVLPEQAVRRQRRTRQRCRGRRDRDGFRACARPQHGRAENCPRRDGRPRTGPADRGGSA